MERRQKGFNWEVKVLYTGSGAFALSWLLLFVLYLPAANSGFIADFTGWLDQIKNHSFLEHINRTNYHGRSLYQVTQFNTWVFYQLFGVNKWLWHLLFITLHALNSTLLFVLCRRIMTDAGVKNGEKIAFGGIVLFCVSPYLSEVIIWEPSFHFLQGLLFILLILSQTLKILHNGNLKHAFYAGIVFLFSTFSLEIFYITPWLVLTLVCFYRLCYGRRSYCYKKVFFYVLIPQIFLFGGHLLLYNAVYGGWVAHISSDVVKAAPLDGLGKPSKYLFNLLFLGRFFPFEIKEKVYHALDGTKAIITFYSIVVLLFGVILFRFQHLSAKGRVAALFFTWMLIALAILIPLWFDGSLLVVYDRYIYFACSFFYILLALLVSIITLNFLRLGLYMLLLTVNLRFAIQTSRYWWKSEKVMEQLQTTIPNPTGKTIILLNIPQNMHGVPMFGAEKESEFLLLHNLLYAKNKITTPLYDCLAYNMLSPEDGANVAVVNDSMLKVTLNQWGTWWWFEGRGGYSRENDEFRLNLTDPGHWYELTLKKPADSYKLLYQVGSEWKTVDMNKKGAVQN